MQKWKKISSSNPALKSSQSLLKILYEFIQIFICLKYEHADVLILSIEEIILHSTSLFCILCFLFWTILLWPPFTELHKNLPHDLWFVCEAGFHFHSPSYGNGYPLCGFCICGYPLCLYLQSAGIPGMWCHPLALIPFPSMAFSCMNAPYRSTCLSNHSTRL